MKKIYVKPAVEIATTHFEDYLMAGSPAQIGDQESPGTGSGPGSHAKKFNMWDNWEEDDESFDSWE